MTPHDMPKRFHDFQRIFNPERVAIVGVSCEDFGFGRGILLSLKAIASGRDRGTNGIGGRG